jgi:ABC-type transport system involved in multi-copper enzyme maturation permease subunit
MLAVLRLELKKSFFSKRSWWIYLLALGPVIICGGHSFVEARLHNPGCDLAEDSMIYAGIFQFYYVKLAIFFGCVGVFSNLIRGEVLEKTLHYYFLTPLRREVMLWGKYLAGLIASSAIFSVCVAASFLLIRAHFGQSFQDFLFRGPGLGHLQAYLIVTVLACIGYGSIFLLLGLMFSNPMIPASLVMIWEAVSGYLPAAAQKISVSFYLKSLTPVQMGAEGPLALIAVAADPAPPELAIPGLLILSAALLMYAGHRVRQFQISYSE